MMKNILVLTLGLLVCLIVISLYKNGYLELVTSIIMFVFVYGVYGLIDNLIYIYNLVFPDNTTGVKK